MSQASIHSAAVEQCRRSGTLYVDNDFPADDSSLYFSRKLPHPVEWKRPKEIAPNAKFLLDGGGRFDVNQGMLEDSWLLAGMAALTCYPGLFHQVVDPEQSFDENYHGVFKFRLFVYDKMTEVIVDDRLPTIRGKLIFVHSNDKNEFWSALLEKAFAKLAGSYEGLKVGQVSEAMVDLTGGVVESITLDKAPDNLHKAMRKAQDRQAMMGCWIESGKPTESRTKLSNGLITGMNYSITGVTKVNIKTRQGSSEEVLVRVRNPWGNEREWTGAWSDQSEEWKFLSESEKRNIGLDYADDGEFWMSINDFKKEFTTLEICNLSPDSVWDSSRRGWEMFQENGEWVRGATAGGCRNFPTFQNNPQYIVVLKDTDDDEDDLCSIVVALRQLGRRKIKKLGQQNLAIGFSIYKMLKENSIERLTKTFFDYHKNAASSGRHSNANEVSVRFKLEPGTYVVIPCTFQTGEESKYLIRIFSEKPHSTRVIKAALAFPIRVFDVCVSSSISIYDATKLLDEQSQFVQENKGAEDDIRDDHSYTSQFLDMFKKIAGDDEELDAYELHKLLSAVFKKDGEKQVGVEGCRALIASFDSDRSGKIGYNDFTKLWHSVRAWMSAFKLYDRDNSGNMDMNELRNALSKLGLRLSTPLISNAALRYASKDGKISMFDFVICVNRVIVGFNYYKAKMTGKRTILTLDDYMSEILKI